MSGSQVYALNCVVCHGSSGEGGTGLSLIESTLSLSEITSVVANGRSGMPAWNDALSAEEIDAVSSYAKGLQQ